MAKSADIDIDMDEWEMLVIPDDDDAFRLFSDELRLDPGEVIRMDHFTCPLEETKHYHHADLMAVVPLEGLEKNSQEEEEEEEERGDVFKDIGVVPHVILNAVSVSEEFDTTNPELYIPHCYYSETLPYTYKFEECPKSVDIKMIAENNEEGEGEEEEDDDDDDDDDAAEGKEHKEADAACCGVKNIWGWRVRGGCIGTLCSIGVAAATICIFILGGRQQHHQHNQRLQFQIYTHDKRMMQQATRLNQALSVVRGVPITRAHISFGGYYDGGL